MQYTWHMYKCTLCVPFSDQWLVERVQLRTTTTTMTPLTVATLLTCLALATLAQQQQPEQKQPEDIGEAYESLLEQSPQLHALLVDMLKEANKIAHRSIVVINADRDSIQERIRQAYEVTDVRGDIRSVARAAIVWTRQFGVRKMIRVAGGLSDVSDTVDQTGEQMLSLVGDSAAEPLVSNALRRLKNQLIQTGNTITVLSRQIVDNMIRIGELVSLRAVRISRQAKRAGTSDGYQEQLDQLVVQAQTAVRRYFAVKDQEILRELDSLGEKVLHEFEPRIALRNYLADTSDINAGCEDDDDQEGEEEEDAENK